MRNLEISHYMVISDISSINSVNIGNYIGEI